MAKLSSIHVALTAQALGITRVRLFHIDNGLRVYILDDNAGIYTSSMLGMRVSSTRDAAFLLRVRARRRSF